MIREILPAEVWEAVGSQAENRSVWLVGGAVRDRFLERASVDFDFAVADDALALARAVADALQGAYFTLDSERGTGRVIAQGGPRVWRRLDFAALRGPTIEDDLKARDFTVNALALELTEGSERLVDPTGGLRDLKDRRLRLCGPRALEDDPVRALRAVRLAAELEFRLDPAVIAAIPRAREGLGRISVERIRDEFFLILSAERPSRPLRVLDQVDLLGEVLPELAPPVGSEAAGGPQGADFNLLRRLEVLMAAIVGTYVEEAAADMTLGQASLRLGRFREDLASELGQQLSVGRPRRSLLVLAALYVGRARTEDGEQLAGRAEALRLSRAEMKHLDKIAAETARTGEWLPPGDDRRALYRFFNRLGKAGVEVALLALSRFLSRSSGPPDQEAWQAKVEQARAVLGPYFEGDDTLLDPLPLVRGDELIQELDLAPGPRVGLLLERIREAQAAGEIDTREQALELARELLTGRAPDQG